MVPLRSILAFALALLLAGCSGGSGKGGHALDAAVDGLDVHATQDTGIIRGVVVDPAIAPIANVTVRIASLDRTATSNAEGAFGFDGLAPGGYFLEASHPAYTTVQGNAEVVAGEQDPAPVKLMLQPLARGEPYVVPRGPR